MPGPKMGPRPPDFNEASLKQSPTYIKWSTLPDGEKLRYACREFIKGHEQDDERLLRRIMIARRNNIRDHETLKVARQRVNVNTLHTVSSTMIPKSTTDSSERSNIKATVSTTETTTAVVHVKSEPTDTCCTSELMDVVDETTTVTPKEEIPHIKIDVDHTNTNTTNTNTTSTTTRTRRPPHTFSDAQIEQEMDVAAVIKTRSYRSWLEVPDGGEFVYNQKYIKGRAGQDWLLRKNIWRRMRYRRENKQLVLQHHRQEKNTSVESSGNNDPTDGNHRIILHTSTNVPQQQRQLRSSSTSTINNNTGLTGIIDNIVMGDETINDVAQLDGELSSTAVNVQNTIVNHNNNEENNDETTTASAAAAAVAAVAASLADEAAVEAAVAAAESHFHLQQQQQQQQEEDEGMIGIDISESDAAVVAAAATDVTTALDDAAIAAAVAVAAAVVASSTNNVNTSESTSNIDLIDDDIVDHDDEAHVAV